MQVVMTTSIWVLGLRFFVRIGKFDDKNDPHTGFAYNRGSRFQNLTNRFGRAKSPTKSMS